MHPNCWTGAWFLQQIPETAVGVHGVRPIFCVLLCCHTYIRKSTHFPWARPSTPLLSESKVAATTRVTRKMSQGWGRPQFSRLSFSHTRWKGKWAVWDAACGKQWRTNEGAAICIGGTARTAHTYSPVELASSFWTASILPSTLLRSECRSNGISKPWSTLRLLLLQQWE